MKKYNILAESDVSTVVANYEPTKNINTSYQSEAEMEQELLNVLINELKYEPFQPENEIVLKDNVRFQLSKLNDYNFSDAEWNYIWNEVIANKKDGIKEKTERIQLNHIFTLDCEDKTTRNIKLIDKNNIYKNTVQVISQYEETNGKYKSIYDVTVLINGLPLVHIELKRRGVKIKEAFNQIDRYQNEAFWASGGLFEYTQIFIISNGTQTKYYPNTTRFNHVKDNNKRNKTNKSRKSFEFTSFWSDEHNRTIGELNDFARTFLNKRTLLTILTKYCVFTTNKDLLVLRPYQIAAVEKIINKVQYSHSFKKEGTIDAGGYIYHATGSGKTLTSFKTAQLATNLPYVDKVLFVVDRRDLDSQTMKEYDKFQKGAANSNTSTKILTKQLEDDNARIVITTIQKLSKFISKNPNHAIYNKHVVLIFDECHRSQFGNMHKEIKKHFNKYNIFGFTGTPIYAKNSNSSNSIDLRTTEQAFGNKLHSYTMVDAIVSKNVLPLKIQYINTISSVNTDEAFVLGIDEEKILNDKRRISKNVEHILKTFDKETKRTKTYEYNGKRVNGFNGMLTVESISMAKKYYTEFQKQLKETNNSLKVATIFTYNPNEDDSLETAEDLNADNLDQSSRDFLENAMNDYNNMFGTNFHATNDGLERYHLDLSERIKKLEVDLVIVVNIFLTGFDAPTLNTLWVDRKLEYHTLIQAFSRTNRVLNSIKDCGNIICFRNLVTEVEVAIALFGGEGARGILLIRPYNDYYYGYKDQNEKQYTGYVDIVKELRDIDLNGGVISITQKKYFVNTYSKLLRLRHILSSFSKFDDDTLMSERELQDLRSYYVEFYEEFQELKKAGTVDINDDVEFELELVKHTEMSVEHIIKLNAMLREKGESVTVANAASKDYIDSILIPKNKKELAKKFIEEVNITSENSEEKWRSYVKKNKEEDLNKIIEEENLKSDKTKEFMKQAFKKGYVDDSGSSFEELLPKMRLFRNNNKRAEMHQRVFEKLCKFFEKYKNED